jgi:RuvB-like protein 1 (pontin 52)
LQKDSTFSFHISSSIFLKLLIDISFLGQQILAIRAQVEGLTVDEESLAYLGEIGDRTSLRHAVQLLTPAKIVAKTNGRDGISKGDLEDIAELFLDAKASARLLQEQPDKYVSQ